MDWPDEEFKPAADAPQREKVPEGRHRFEIVRASEEGSKLKLSLSLLGPDGQPDKRYGWVWDSPLRDKDWGRRRVANLAAALGLSPAAWKATAVADLEGRQVEAEIVHKQGDRTVWVNVDRYYAPATAAAAPAAKPARKPAAAQQLADDDIPF